MIKKNSIIPILLFIFGLSLALPARADFDPNFIISDEDMLDASAMSLEEIKAFLQSKNSYLSNYSTMNCDGQIKTAAEIIYEAANNYDCEGITLSDKPTLAEKKQKCKPVTINPKMLLVLLQKEQSLIEDSEPTQRQLDWAVGYGCFDGQACNTRWQGLGKQLNSASLQFYDYVTRPNAYTYQAGKTYTVSNTGSTTSIIKPVNNATAALYNYTPHVYNGNYNFHKLWGKYFTISYPNGSLLQAAGEPGVWLIRNGQKSPFTTKGALTSRYDLNKIIMVSKTDLDAYPKGAPIKFPQYSLVRSPSGSIYLLIDDKKRLIENENVFKQIGYNPEEVFDASWEDINSYTLGTPITASSTYITGALLQDKKTGGVYYVEDGIKAPLWDASLLKTKFKKMAVVPVESAKLDSYQTTSPVLFNDGEILKSSASPAVYIIENGKKRPFISGQVFEDLGYKWENIITVSPKLLALYDLGEDISIKK